jgi:putative endopeptidase
MKRPLILAITAAVIVVCPLTPSHRWTAFAAQPLSSGIDLSNMDKSVRPQDDLFRAVSGLWLKKTEIPADRADYGAFTALAEQAEKDVHKILESCADAKDNPPGSDRQKIGDMYASYMDEKRAEELGIKPIAAMLANIDQIDSKAALVRTIAELNRVGVSGVLNCGVENDAKGSGLYTLYLFQSGLGLPDRDYYWDPRFKAKLAAYGQHIEHMLSMAQVPDAKQAAADIVAFETALAKAQWSKEDSRNSTKTCNYKTREELVKLAPGFGWELYFATVGVSGMKEFIVMQPSYFAAMAGMADSVPLRTWKAWLKWHVIESYASLLNKEMADAAFAFYGTTLQGVPQNRPRWKRAVSAVEGALGEAVGKLYVAEHFQPEAKARMDGMVANIIAAYRKAFQNNEWMSPETKRQALAKLAAFNPKIGYPVKWRDYSSLEIRRDDLVGNIERASDFEWNRQLARLGKPIDREEWQMTPQTVNAYYNEHMNEIVFPAAILQPPFFNPAADDAVNYGGIGAVIGHETGHGFDDQGSKWDEAGRLRDWWTPTDRKEFEKRGAALAAQYSRFEPLPGFKVNGKLTLGENIADLSGLTISYAAYHLSLNGKPAPVIDGLTGDQRFFMGFAQVWRRKHRDDDLKNRLLIDPHSPAEFRANGTPRNVSGFYPAFGVKLGDKMYLPPEERVKIW